MANKRKSRQEGIEQEIPEYQLRGGARGEIIYDTRFWECRGCGSIWRNQGVDGFCNDCGCDSDDDGAYLLASKVTASMEDGSYWEDE